MRHPETPVSYESFPAPSGHTFPHFGYIHRGERRGGRGGGALILDHVEHSTYLQNVDAHLCCRGTTQAVRVGLSCKAVNREDKRSRR